MNQFGTGLIGARRAAAQVVARAMAWLAAVVVLANAPGGEGQQRLSHYARVVLFVGRLEVLNKLQVRAQALTYQTLLAIVPLLAVFFAIFKGFGGLERVQLQVESLIVENLAGSPDLQQTLRSYIGTFVKNIHGGALGAVSVVILIYSVLGLLNQIEDSFNDIFGVKKGRPWNVRIVLYWTALTLGPLLLAASLALTAALDSNWFEPVLRSLGVVGAFLLRSTPLLFTWVAFAALYMVVPNARVRVRAALFAALVAGSMWNVAKWGYAWYAGTNVTMQNVYGALAAVPLFILWLYVSWLLVLFGAQLAFAFQHAATYREEEVASRASHDLRERAACRFFLEIARDFYAGRPPTDAERAATNLGIPRKLIQALAEQLEQGGFVRQVEPDLGWVPAKDLEQVTVEHILAHLGSVGTAPAYAHDEPRRVLDALFEGLRQERRRAAGTVNFRDLASRLAQGPRPSALSSDEPAMMSEGTTAVARVPSLKPGQS